MVTISGNDLTLNEVVNVAKNKAKVVLADNAVKLTQISHEKLIRIADSEIPVYGINTGFGIFSDKHISLKQSKRLNRNLIVSHAVATGPSLVDDIVRAAILVRINALAKGFSGINPTIIETLIRLLNENIIPQIPSQGSLGSSGDLCMLSQLALTILKDEFGKTHQSGEVKVNGKIFPAKDALSARGIDQITFANKDGLALINGATFSAAMAALAVAESGNLFALSNAALALSLEALCARSEAFEPQIHAARGLEGQIRTAASIRKLVKGSKLINSQTQIQDAYSLRCAPQVQGAIYDTINYVEGVITKEINAATDNPLIFEDDKIFSGGNFHGEPIALAADFLSIALTELGAISERRIFRMMDSNLSRGLPSMLTGTEKGQGLDSGIMLLQYTAAALALENQTLATPDSIRSLPTSANQEDHNANSYNAARNLLQIVSNTRKIFGIEIYTAIRAIHMRLEQSKALSLGEGTQALFDLLFKYFPYNAGDSLWRDQLELFYDMLDASAEKEKILSIVN